MKVDKMTELVGVFEVGNSVPVPPNPRTEQEIMESWVGDIDNPRVSIICHTYNHINYIRDALNGFLMQKTDFPFEIIVHDDASTDGTRKIVQEYAEKYGNIIKIILQDNNQFGLGKSPLSFTWKKAKGKYIALCEGDDYWTDVKKIQIQAQYLEQNPEVSVTFHDAYSVDSLQIQGMVLSPRNRRNYKEEEHSLSPFIPTLTRMVRNFDYTWLMVKALPVAGDVCLSSFAGRFGSAVYLNDIEPAVYRIHHGGVWSSKSNLEKIRISVDSKLFIAARYERENNRELQLAFMEQAIGHIVDSFSVKEIVFYTFKFCIYQYRYLIRKLKKTVKRKLKKIVKRES